MKKVSFVLTLILVLLPQEYSIGQTAKLKLYMKDYSGRNEFDSEMYRIFKGMLEYIRSKNETFPYREIDVSDYTYKSEPSNIKEDAIAIMTPIKYLQSKEILKDYIVPLFIVNRRHEKLPYYSAFLIANVNSDIESLNDESIKTLYLVSENSTSGYVMPLYKLYDSGIIRKPDINAARERWVVVELEKHRAVVDKIKKDKNAIGAVWQFDGWENPEQKELKVLLRYGLIPQDVLVISRDLKQYRTEIEDWFKTIFEKDSSQNFVTKEGEILAKSSKKITGLLSWNQEYGNAFKDLQLTYNRQKKKASLPVIDDNFKIGDVFNLIRNLKVFDFFALLTMMFSILGLTARVAYHLGTKRRSDKTEKQRRQTRKVEKLE